MADTREQYGHQLQSMVDRPVERASAFPFLVFPQTGSADADHRNATGLQRRVDPGVHRCGRRQLGFVEPDAELAIADGADDLTDRGSIVAVE